MLTFSFPMPRNGDRGGLLVVLVMGPDNLERMKAGDPFDLQFRAYHGHWQIHRPLSDVDLVICYEQDETAVREFAGRQDTAGLLRYLERGRVHRQGDALPPRKLEETQS